MSQEHLGIIGGGQLGSMLQQAALELGIPVRISDPEPTAPGRQLAGGLPAEDWAEAARLVAEGARAVTWEREDLDPDDLARLAVEVWPRPSLLANLRERLGHKLSLGACDIATAPWAVARDGGCVERVLETLSLPLMVKARRGGFDGRGQELVREREALGAALERFRECGSICESLIDFDDEFAVLLTRGRDGEQVHYPLVFTHQEHGQLAWAVAPHPLSAQLESWARPMARKLADHLEHVGTLAVECFRRGDELLVNEIAPRVHNSGHWTIEGCSTSQFANHVRAVCGLALVEPVATGVCLMRNCIGSMPAVEAHTGRYCHDYGKRPRPGRKVGHINLVAADYEELWDRIQELPAELRPSGDALPWRAQPG